MKKDWKNKWFRHHKSFLVKSERYLPGDGAGLYSLAGFERAKTRVDYPRAQSGHSLPFPLPKYKANSIECASSLTEKFLGLTVTRSRERERELFFVYFWLCFVFSSHSFVSSLFFVNGTPSKIKPEKKLKVIAPRAERKRKQHNQTRERERLSQ